MHGSDRVPDLNTDCRRAWGWQSNGNSFNESEMALFYECMRMCAQKLLDTADIVRDVDFGCEESSNNRMELLALEVIVVIGSDRLWFLVACRHKDNGRGHQHQHCERAERLTMSWHDKSSLRPLHSGSLMQIVSTIGTTACITQASQVTIESRQCSLYEIP